MSFIGVIYRNTGESLLTEEQMIQKQLHHQSPPQDWQEHENFGNPKHSFQAAQHIGQRALPKGRS